MWFLRIELRTSGSLSHLSSPHNLCFFDMRYTLTYILKDIFTGHSISPWFVEDALFLRRLSFMCVCVAFYIAWL